MRRRQRRVDHLWVFAMSAIDPGVTGRATPSNRADRRLPSTTPYEIKPLRYTVAEVSLALRCSQLFVYELIKQGRLKAQGSRRKLWVTAQSVEDYFASQPEYRPADAAE
jgi:excisionase family DNA binding protein